LFTLIIILLLYGTIGLVYAFLMLREVNRGPANGSPETVEGTVPADTKGVA
jgi:hypothetical protein